MSIRLEAMAGGSGDGKASIPYLLYNPFVFSDEDCLLPERTIYLAQGWLLRALTPPQQIYLSFKFFDFDSFLGFCF
ncbi:unnamed protein product [Brassica napus]|uniref:(rape) hypothetical protein n=1 Tax=Brassica napus TaxID=3708 RepID=A0A816J4G8_BRANA|nr:unnamed protein product [Brassica napus]